MVACDNKHAVRTKTGFCVLVALVARRLLLGDEVAAAKYGTDMPIDDPARERQLLAEMIERARAIGLDPELSVRFFQAQIEANKVVQLGLFERWASAPVSRPRRRPDLKAEIRPRVDAINAQLLDQLKTVVEEPSVPHADSEPELSGALDKLHRHALRIALAPVRDTDDRH